MTLSDVEIEKITLCLKHYHKKEYQRITNYEKVIQNREELENGIYKYPCPCQPVYLDNNGYAVHYDRQIVYEGDVYYDFNNYDVDYTIAGTPTYINSYEWKRSSSGGGGISD